MIIHLIPFSTTPPNAYTKPPDIPHDPTIALRTKEMLCVKYGFQLDNHGAEYLSAENGQELEFASFAKTTNISHATIS